MFIGTISCTRSDRRYTKHYNFDQRVHAAAGVFIVNAMQCNSTKKVRIKAKKMNI